MNSSGGDHPPLQLSSAGIIFHYEYHRNALNSDYEKAGVNVDKEGGGQPFNQIMRVTTTTIRNY